MSYRFYKDAETSSSYGDIPLIPPTSVPGIFRGCKLGPDFKLDFWNCNKYGIDDMSYMFAGSGIRKFESNTIGAMTSVGLKDYTARSNFTAMFKDCTYLTSFKCYKWRIEPQFLNDMFDGCTSLQTVDMSDSGSAFYNYLNSDSWDIQMDRMFRNCVSLKEMHLDAMRWRAPGFYVDQMFFGCINLEHIYVPLNYSDWTIRYSEWNPGIRGDNVFFGDTKLPKWDGDYSNKKCKLVSELGYFESTEPFYPLYYWAEEKVVGGELQTILHLSNARETSDYKVWIYTESPWQQYNTATSVITEGDTLVLPPDIRKLFYGCYYLETIDTTKWDTQYAERMGYMFYGCGNLSLIQGISNWDMINTYDLQHMFENCSSLKTLNLTGWDLFRGTSISPWGYASALAMFKNSPIEDLRIGPNTFNNVEDLNRYQKDPYHCEHIKTLMHEIRETSIAVDYEF